MEKNEILFITGKDYKNMTLNLLKKANLADMIPDKKLRIAIKPNLVTASEAKYGATTHPEIVSGIIEYLQDGGFDNICMIEGSWVGDATSEAAQVCGYNDISDKYGVPFIDAQKSEPIKCVFSDMTLNVCRDALDIDFLINVPVLKGHCQTKVTCALKNMKGLIPNTEKRRFHKLGLHKPIAHLNGIIRQDFIVVDHICGDLDFEDGGHPVERNCIMCARDPVLMDAYALSLLKYKPDEVPYVTMAEALGIGLSDISKANISYCGGDTLKMPKLPVHRKLVEVCDSVNEVESCSACYGYLIPTLYRLMEEGELDKLDQKICIGQGFKNKSGNLGVGNCTAGFDFCIKGCPPTPDNIYKALKAYLNLTPTS